MKRYKFECPDDVRDFLEELVDDGLTFHLDDDPEDIFEGEIAYLLKLNMIDLWKYCDPWQVMEYYPETEKKYMDRDEEAV
jgi:hypothetical protein